MKSGKMRILIMGLPGSGKSTLARKLSLELPLSYMINADAVREDANDWDFSDEGRIRQARRIRDIADNSVSPCVIADFVCGTIAQRDIYRPHVLVWMNTIAEGRFEDTNKAFVRPVVEPLICKVRFDSFEEVNVQRVIDAIIERCPGCSEKGGCNK
jgi:adenylylsulfate kinase